MNEYYVYILTNKHKTVLYTGLTNNIQKRLHEHKSKIHTKSFTAKYNVEYLVYYEHFDSIIYAIAREKAIKRLTRIQKDKLIANVNKSTYPQAPTVATISQDISKISGRNFRTIDFILPGQLGFSLLSAGVFGVAFLFFNLRQQLVLKRFFATPINRTFIVLGEALSRVLFQMSTAVVIVLIGAFFFNYTLVNGITTFLEIMVLSFIALVVFMGFGFIVSGFAKNESTIPPFANMFTLPQFLLAGTFFPIDSFPSWLQPLCKILPLTHFNDAMRQIAFEGASLADCGLQIGVLVLWGVVIYAIAIKVFKWE